MPQPQIIQKPVFCDDHSAIIKILTETLNEKPLWQGKTESSTVIFLINPKTNSWTIIETNGNIACVIAVGVNLEPLKLIKHN